MLVTRHQPAVLGAVAADLSAPALRANSTINAGTSVIDSMATAAIAPGQELVFRGDVDGFAAGSQFSWNVLGAYSFTFAVRMASPTRACWGTGP